MKIALISDQLSLRNDIISVISKLGEQQSVVLYVSKSDKQFISENVEVRIVGTPRVKIKDKFFKRLYTILGNIPRTRRDYKRYNLRRIEKDKSQKNRKKLSLLLKLQLYLPRIISYSSYTQKISESDCKIDDIDIFLFFTDITNDYLFASAVNSKKPVYVFVYSWDHIMKFRKFPTKNITYICWNSDLAQDLVNIHKVPKNIIKELGASQFCSIAEYLNNKTEPKHSPPAEKYFYFVASMGYLKLAKQEVKIAVDLAEKIKEHFPDVTLVFRPYPNLNDWSVYDDLIKVGNVKFDSYQKDKKSLLDKNDVTYKFDIMKQSIAIIHSGTTVGLEGSYFDVPVIYLTPKDMDFGCSEKDISHLKKIWMAHHLKTYYDKEEYVNVITNSVDLVKVLSMCLEKDKQLFDYSNKLKKISPLLTTQQFSDQLIQIISK